MQDILIKQQPDGTFDIEFENGDFKSTTGLDTAIIMSLFVDKRASQDEISEPSLRRGWQGNELNNDSDYEIGSKLFLLDQSRATQKTVNNAESYASDGLSHFIQDGIAKKIDVSGESSGSNVTLNIEFTRDENQVDSKQYMLWENTSIV
jgi:phage gp46-like protein